MKLAVFVDQVFWFDGHTYSTSEAFLRFITAFGAYFDGIQFYGRVPEERRVAEYLLDPDKTMVHPLPWYESVYALATRWPLVLPQAARTFRRTCDQWDLLWLAMPHPVSLLFASLCKKTGKDFFMTVAQDLVTQLKHRCHGLRKAIAVPVAALLERQARRLAMTHPTFTVGREIYHLYKRNNNPVFPTTVSLISKKDVASSGRREMRPGEVVKLLTVGRLSSEKGGSHLLEAVRLLIREAGVNVSLTVVGTGDEEHNLKQKATQLGLSGHVQFLGFIPETQLFATYRQSDLFVLASLTEGVPIVLLEAMAFGVPVIATRVGGIPYLVRDEVNGLLVDPANAHQLAGAVRRLVDDQGLRDRLVNNGLTTAMEHSKEAEVGRMVGTLRRSFPALRI